MEFQFTLSYKFFKHRAMYTKYVRFESVLTVIILYLLSFSLQDLAIAQILLNVYATSPRWSKLLSLQFKLYRDHFTRSPKDSLSILSSLQFIWLIRTFPSQNLHFYSLYYRTKKALLSHKPSNLTNEYLLFSYLILSVGSQSCQ